MQQESWTEEVFYERRYGYIYLFLKTRNWLRQPMMGRTDFSHAANKLTSMAF
jgi:hypothetical protein